MSEEIEVSSQRRMNKKPLGRGLGSLLREASAQNDSHEETRPVMPPKTEIKSAIATSAASSVNAPAGQPTTVASPQPAERPANDKDRIWTIAIEKLRANKEQPRKTFDPTKLQELAISIKEKGVMLPIVARTISPNLFEIIAGERRWRAAQLAGLQEVPVLLRSAENRDALELALIENIQRQDLLPIEEAEAYSVLATRYGLTQQEIAQKVGKDRSTVSNLMRLMGLAIEVKAMMRQGELQLGQAKVLLALENLNLQTTAARKVVQQQLSVRATEKLVVKLKESDSLKVEDILASEEMSHREIVPLINELQKMLGTKVEIDSNGQRGKVVMHFYSMPELNQLVDKLRKAYT